MAERPASQWDQEWVGAVLTLPLHLLQIPLAILVGVVGCLVWPGAECAVVVLFLLPIFGVTQLLYMGPAILIAFVIGRRRLAIGLLGGAALTLILNAACWGLVVGRPF
jgi:hypothetical protein